MNRSRTAGLSDHRLLEPEHGENRKELISSIGEARDAAEVTQEPGKYAELGELLARAGHLVEAEAAYRTAVTLPGGNFARHRDAWAEVLERLGRIDEAIAVTEQTIELDPGRPTRYLRLGQLMIRGGDFKQANTILYRGLRLDPKSKELNSSIAEVRKLLDSSDRTRSRITNAEYLLGGIILFLLCGPGFLISVFPDLTSFQIMDDNWILYDFKARGIFGAAFFALFGLGIVGIIKGLRNMAPPGSRLDRMMSPWRWFYPR